MKPRISEDIRNGVVRMSACPRIRTDCCTVRSKARCCASGSARTPAVAHTYRGVDGAAPADRDGHTDMDTDTGREGGSDQAMRSLAGVSPPAGRQSVAPSKAQSQRPLQQPLSLSAYPYIRVSVYPYIRYPHRGVKPSPRPPAAARAPPRRRARPCPPGTPGACLTSPLVPPAAVQ